MANRGWGMRLLLALDQLGHVVLSPVLFYTWDPDEDETISSRLGKLKRAYGGTIPWRYPIARVLDIGLEWIDPGHSLGAIEEDEGDPW